MIQVKKESNSNYTSLTQLLEAPDKRAHYKLCSLIPEISAKKSDWEIHDTATILSTNWAQLMPSPQNLGKYWRKKFILM